MGVHAMRGQLGEEIRENAERPTDAYRVYLAVAI